MLRLLRIEHLAVIDAVQVEFEPGLNVLTGETGAGKSMLVEAIGLLMGGRASADLIRTGETHAHVQAEFDDLIVRRDINAQGRSRAFVNDALVTAALLGEQTCPLVELHGQHEHQTLLDPQSHLMMLDEFAGLRAERSDVGHAFREWKRLQSEFEAFQMDEREKAARIDLLKFQVDELTKANLRPGEDDELETSRRVLGSADQLQRLSSEAYAALYESDDAALGRLSTVWKRVAELAEVDPAFRPHLESRDAIKSQLEDLAEVLRGYGTAIDASPARLQDVEDRLALIERMKRKYGPALSDVLEMRSSLSRQLNALQNADELRGQLEADVQSARETFLTRARALSRRRRDAAKDFSARIQVLLTELAIDRKSVV